MTDAIYIAATAALGYRVIVVNEVEHRMPGPETMIVGDLVDAIDVAMTDADPGELDAPCVTVPARDGVGIVPSVRQRLEFMRGQLVDGALDVPIDEPRSPFATRAAAELQALGVL